MIDAEKVGERRDVLVTEKQNVGFQDLTLVHSLRSPKGKPSSATGEQIN
jgi:hypothetical protein